MKFTDKQKQVMELTCSGKTITQICETLSKCRTTIKAHQKVVKNAFGTNDLLVAAVKYTENRVRTEVAHEYRERERYLEQKKGMVFSLPDNDLSAE